MSMLKKMLALLLALTMVIGLLSACGAETPAPTDGGNKEPVAGNETPTEEVPAEETPVEEAPAPEEQNTQE